MSGSYTITILNKSGSTQAYSIFAQPAIVTGPASGVTVISSIVMCLTGVVSGEAYAYFSLSKDIWAMCGKKDPNGGGSEVVEFRRVVVQNNEIPINGSALNVVVAEATPIFTNPAIPISPAAALKEGCFGVKTQSDFSVAEANRRKTHLDQALQGAVTTVKFFIGYTSTRGPQVGSYSTYTPAPNMSYEIKPSNAMCILTGKYEVDSTVSAGNIQSPAATANFDQLGDHVTYVHMSNGKLVLREDLLDSVPSLSERVTKGKVIHEKY